MGRPEEEAYFELDAAVRETLERSFAARMAGTLGGRWVLDNGVTLGAEEEAALNLDNGFWGRSPRSAWEAACNAGAEWVSLLVRVFERVRGIDPTLGLWRQIKYVRNGWWGGSGGFKVVYFDPGAMRRQLDELVENRAGNKVCRDQLVGSLEHQLGSSMRGAARALVGRRAGADEGRDADTWREVDRPGAEGLHFCVSREDMKAPGPGGPARHVRLDDIHLDWRSPVKGINREGTCEYTGAISGLRHWAQARFQTERPLFAFHETDRCIQGLFAATGALPPGLAAEREALWQEWESRRFSLAVQGTAGLAGATAFHARATALSRRLPRR